MACDRGPLSLARKVRFLKQPASYPEPTTGVRAIETHMSWVFATDAFVYKMRKPVRLRFLDFSTLDRRRQFCEASLRLNRRLAASVYLAVVTLAQDERGRLRIGGNGRPVEWLEKMRRLPEDRMLDVAIERGTVTAAEVRRFATVLARFYRNAPPVQMTPAGYRHRLIDTVDGNLQALRERRFGFDAQRLVAIAAAQHAFIEHHGALLDARVTAGRIIEAHGDLRPEHVCLLADPVFIDCLEFDRELRLMDVADELAYLTMECEFSGAPFIGDILLDSYQRETGDPLPPPLVRFYRSLRATVRAKLAAWHLDDYPQETHAHWLGCAGRYLELAELHIAAARNAPPR